MSCIEQFRNLQWEEILITVKMLTLLGGAIQLPHPDLGKCSEHNAIQGEGDLYSKLKQIIQRHWDTYIILN